MPHQSTRRKQSLHGPASYPRSMNGCNGGYPTLSPYVGNDFGATPRTTHMNRSPPFHHVVHTGGSSPDHLIPYWKPTHNQYISSPVPRPLKESSPISNIQSESERDFSSPRTLPSYCSRSFDSPPDPNTTERLMSSTMQKRVSPKEARNNVPETSVPLKKRKTVMQMHRNPVVSPFHASPISHSSKAVASISLSSNRIPSYDSRVSSYDSKDGQALLESSKIVDPTDIKAEEPGMKDFPNVLHSVLSDSEFAGKVVQWLPHGKAWRIVRFDALRKLVLPKFFANLRQPNNNETTGSIDTFLKYLSSWGFEEVTDGPDVGAYTNVLFRRGLRRLCSEMKFKPWGKEDSIQIIESSKQPQSILRVPSLASTVDTLECTSSKEMDGQFVQMNPSGSSERPESWRTNQWERSPDNRFLRQTPPSEAWPCNYQSAVSNSFKGSEQSRNIQYSPVRIRSSRGAPRTLSRTKAPAQYQNHPQLQKRPCAFPVSNRGRGKVWSPRPFSPSVHPSTSPVSIETNVMSIGQSRSTLNRKEPLASSPEETIRGENVTAV
jgi:hypothetical protein